MREIKFRAWDGSKMWNWEDITKDKEILCSVMRNEFYATIPPKYFWQRQQYTGLKDKNGVEIYEGDLLVGKNTNGKYRDIYLVDFNNENYAWLWGWNLLDYGYIGREGFVKGKKVKWNNSDKVDYPSPEYYYGKTIEKEYYEVIGNVFEGIKDE